VASQEGTFCNFSDPDPTESLAGCHGGGHRQCGWFSLYQYHAEEEAMSGEVSEFSLVIAGAVSGVSADVPSTTHIRQMHGRVYSTEITR
jgi:hypothetical protein